MRNSLRVKTLAAVVVASLGGIAAPAAWSQATVSDGAAPATEVSPYQIYMIRFNEPGALEYQGGIGSLAATVATGGNRFDANSDASRAYRQYLEQRQAEYIEGMRVRIGRDVEVPHTYQTTHSGISAKLTEAEAAIVATLPGVSSIERDREYQLDTFRGPSFIGANTVWGANVPTPATATNFGKGVVIGVLDSGVNSTHPSFANDARCGFSGADPKMRSMRDCSTSAGGVCTGPNGAADATGHGSHTASTSGGNVLDTSTVPAPVIPAPYTNISGVAPCATLRTYRVCEGSSCSGASISAGFNNVLNDGDVDVVNYSISGGGSPWSSGDGDRAFLEFVNNDIFVSASAGNTRAEVPNPVGNVNHLGPWVMSVASSTHDENPVGGELSAAGPGTPPVDTQNIGLNIAGVNVGTAGIYPIRYNSANDIGCTANGGFPANFFSGAIALIPRGTCSFEEKLNNAAAAGAVAGIVYNNAAGAINMAIGTASLPSYSILQVQGLALRAFIDANGATPTTVDFTPATKIGDMLSSFSLRGPSRPAAVDITKPDITAPGDSIYAAYSGAGGVQYASMGGTSMSSPHVAGAGALVRAMRPGWTPMMVKSALQLTAKSEGVKEDGVTPWHPDDTGNGRAQVDRAVAAGLVMDETYARFLAANPSGGSINMKELNIPSMRNTNCVPDCTFVRTFTSTLAAASTWNITSESTYGVNISASPSNFTIPAGGTQAVTFTVALDDYGPGTQVPNTPAFAKVLLTPSVAAVSPVEHLTVAVRGTRDGIFRDGFDPDEVANPNHVTFTPNHEVHNSLNGTCIKWLTGVVRDNLASCPGDDFNPYVTGGSLAFYWAYTGATANRGGSASGSAYTIAAPGTEIGPSTTFIDTLGSAPTAAWRVAGGADGYLGFRFLNTETSTINYGYVRINTTGAAGTTGLPATIVSYTFDNSGAPISVPMP